MPKRDPFSRIRKFCLSLPDTKETITWGTPHFRVGDKIFCGCGEQRDRPVIGFKLPAVLAQAVVDEDRFWRAPYVGHKGWVSMDVRAVKDWNQVQEFILESYRLIAPKRSLAKLEQTETSGIRKRTRRR